MYYKTIKSNLTFDEAIEKFKKGSIIRHDNTIIDPYNVNTDDLKFSWEQITSRKWEVIDSDYKMMNKLDDVREMVHDINLNIDSRFHYEANMDISSYWNLFDHQFVIGDENLQYEFMKYYINNYIKDK